MTKQTKKPSRATSNKSSRKPKAPTPKAAASKPVVTIESPELLRHVDAIHAIAKQTALNMSEIGRHLIECKQIVGHGSWTAWLKREFSWSQDTAERFMRLAADPIEFRKLRNLNLPVSSIYLLVAPSTPEAVREEIIDRAKKGEKVEHKAVVAAVKAAKKPKATAKAKPATKTKPAKKPTAMERADALRRASAEFAADAAANDVAKTEARAASNSIGTEVEVGFDAELHEKIEQFALKRGETVSDVVHAAVLWHIDQRKAADKLVAHVGEVEDTKPQLDLIEPGSSKPCSPSMNLSKPKEALRSLLVHLQNQFELDDEQFSAIVASVAREQFNTCCTEARQNKSSDVKGNLGSGEMYKLIHDRDAALSDAEDQRALVEKLKEQIEELKDQLEVQEEENLTEEIKWKNAEIAKLQSEIAKGRTAAA